MSKKNYKILSGILVFAFVFGGACSLSAPTEVDQISVATQSQMLIEAGRSTQTAAAFYTQVAQATLAAGAVTLPPVLTNTVAASPTIAGLQPSATLLPTSTAIPSFTPAPSFTSVPPTATPNPIPCDRASFVDDVTIPDGTVISPGSVFTKTWRLKNTGSCKWTTDYSVVFVSGDKMEAGSSMDLTAEVSPGSTLDLSIEFEAPDDEGEYKGSWRLRSANGNEFGTGSDNNSFYVKIMVEAPETDYNLDFAGTYCNASWSSGAGDLACPGDSSSNGYIQRIDKPTLESGYIDDEPVLLTVPQKQTDGVIRGKYPAYTVKSGDHFRAVLGCQNKAEKCSVKFELSYIIDGESTIQTAGSWVKAYDGTNLSVDLDLASLEGKKVRFILTVFANGAMEEDRAQWLAPRIIKP